EPADKSRIGQAFFAHRSVETLDPKRAEAALLGLAVAIGVEAGLLHRRVRSAEGVLAAAVIAFRLLQNFLVTGMSGDAALNACHVRISVRLGLSRDRTGSRA